MSKFEWQTDDDWDEEVEQSAEIDPRYRLFLTFCVVGLVALTAAIVFTHLRRTVDEALTQTEADVSAAFGLLHDSAENGDIELFSTYLSGRDRDWTTAYQQLVASGDLLRREGMQLDLTSAQPAIAAVTLDPTLRSAIVTATLDYGVAIGNGLTQTVTLEQPYHFRQGATQWLFAPPEEAYWGEMQISNGSRLTYSYSVRDAMLVSRLMRDIGTAYDSMCRREVGLTCAEKWQIVFEREPDALKVLDEREWADRRLMTLPSPTLVGLPTNEDSYRALLSGYARLFFTRVLAVESDFVCCRKKPIFDAFVDQTLAELGLRANLNSPRAVQLAQQHLAPTNWPFDWEGTFDSPTNASLEANHATVLFLRQQYPNISTYEMLALLPRYVDRADWLQHVILLVDSTADNIPSSEILGTTYVDYINWLEQRTTEYAAQSGQ